VTAEALDDADVNGDADPYGAYTAAMLAEVVIRRYSAITTAAWMCWIGSIIATNNYPAVSSHGRTCVTAWPTPMFPGMTCIGMFTLLVDIAPPAWRRVFVDPKRDAVTDMLA
jgi:hypothetical protein